MRDRQNIGWCVSCAYGWHTRNRWCVCYSIISNDMLIDDGWEWANANVSYGLILMMTMMNNGETATTRDRNEGRELNWKKRSYKSNWRLCTRFSFSFCSCLSFVAVILNWICNANTYVVRISTAEANRWSHIKSPAHVCVCTPLWAEHSHTPHNNNLHLHTTRAIADCCRQKLVLTKSRASRLWSSQPTTKRRHKKYGKRKCEQSIKHRRTRNQRQNK